LGNDERIKGPENRRFGIRGCFVRGYIRPRFTYLFAYLFTYLLGRGNRKKDGIQRERQGKKKRVEGIRPNFWSFRRYRPLRILPLSTVGVPYPNFEKEEESLFPHSFDASYAPDGELQDPPTTVNVTPLGPISVQKYSQLY